MEFDGEVYIVYQVGRVLQTFPSMDMWLFKPTSRSNVTED